MRNYERIGKIAGKCIMPQECIFARVIKGGKIRARDEIIVLPAVKVFL